MPDTLPLDCRQLSISVKHLPDLDPTKPIPLLIKANTAEPNAWATPDGRRVFINREDAEVAIHANSEAGKAQDAIRQQKEHLLHDAKILVAAHVVENWTGWVTLTGDEDYFEDTAALLQHYRNGIIFETRAKDPPVTEKEIADSLPAWCFTTTETGFDFDLSEAIDTYLSDEHHKDAGDSIKGWNELQAFWKEWSAKQTLSTYWMDCNNIVVLDRPRYEAELAAARALLAEVQP